MICALGKLVAVGVLASACQEHNVGGEKAATVFPDSHVAALARAACEGDTAEIARLIGQKVNVNAVGTHTESVLFWAVFCENGKGVEALLKAGADPNYAARYGLTSVIVASSYRNADMLNLLLKHGGDKNAQDSSGSSALEVAFNSGARNGWWDGYYALLSAGAKPVTNGGKQTMIAHAVYANRYDKAIELLDRKFTDPDLAQLARTPYLTPIEQQADLEARVAFLLRLKKDGVDIAAAKNWVRENKRINGIDAVEAYARAHHLEL